MVSDIKVGIYTLGCKVNQYESEAIAEALEKECFCILPPDNICDIYIINTCTVTGEADRKAGQFIRRAIKKNPNAYIIVCGCFSQVSPESVAKIEGVDYICGNSDKMSVVKYAKRFALERIKNNCAEISIGDVNSLPFEDMHITKFDRTRAYVKIEDGCENHCTYCIIPYARGRVRSKRPSDVISEVKDLIKSGCKEIVLTGIETAAYGRDFEKYGLAELLCDIDALGDLPRIRLGSLDVSLMRDGFVSKIRDVSSLAPHFHLSVQSGCDKILSLMKRKYNTKMALENIKRIRASMPKVMFSTDIIVGFPGETEQDFNKTLEFIKEAQFLNVHVFPYSRRKGTPAAQMSGQVSQEQKHLRVEKLQAIQNDIKREMLKSEINNRYEVLFESFFDGFAFGHTENFIEVYVKSEHPLTSEIREVELFALRKNGCEGKLV